MSRVEKIAQKIAAAMLLVQRRTSDVVNGLMRGRSLKQMKLGLFAFVITSVSISCYVIADAVTKTKVDRFEVQPIRSSPFIIIDDDRLFGRSDEEKLEQYLQRYKDAIDSIRLQELQK